MLVHSLHNANRRLPAALLILLSLFALLAFSSPARADSSAPASGRTPVGAVPGDGLQASPATVKRRGGALLPKRQVNPVAAKFLVSALPTSVDLSTHSVAVGDQGSIGSCVAWTVAYAMLGWYSRHDNVAGQPFHPMYMYSQIHADNSAGGGGSFATDALNLAYNQGNDTMAHYSRSTTDFINQPTASERANAANWKITGWQTLFANMGGSGGGTTGANLIQTTLANGKPVAIALPIRPGFDNVTSTAYHDDDVSGTSRGFHEVMATGYDQYGLWIQNSWGTTWGYNGYARLSWRVVESDVYQAHTISGFAARTAIDTTPPTMGAIAQQFPLGQQTTATQTPVQFTWSATDAGGVGAYEVYWSTDNGATWVKDTSVGTTATSIIRFLGYGGTYKYAVRARDTAGNWSAYSYSVAVTPRATDDKAYTVASPWARYSLSDSFGGTYIATSKAGAYIQNTFTGRDAALIAPKFSTAGRATVYCDGVASQLVDLYSSTTVNRQVVGQCHFAQSGTHTMKIVAEGTSGRPWLGVDAFAILQ